ncbi:hypothetical protein NW765_015286 [Fusarium oxysporum]|nr:hypothetical protein NW765_015286 [Fusarium oxysporum]
MWLIFHLRLLPTEVLKNRATLGLIDSDTTFEQYTQTTTIQRSQPYLARSLDTRGCQLVHGRDEPVRSESPRRWPSTRSKAPKAPRLHSGLDYIELLKSSRCVSSLWEETRGYHHHNSRPKRRLSPMPSANLSQMRCRLWSTIMSDERRLSTRSYDIPLHFPQYSFTGSVVNSPRLLGGGRKLLSFTKPHFDQHASNIFNIPTTSAYIPPYPLRDPIPTAQ